MVSLWRRDPFCFASFKVNFSHTCSRVLILNYPRILSSLPAASRISLALRQSIPLPPPETASPLTSHPTLPQRWLFALAFSLEHSMRPAPYAPPKVSEHLLCARSFPSIRETANDAFMVAPHGSFLQTDSRLSPLSPRRPTAANLC